MVCLKSSMAAAPERASAKPLHNFDLPWLRWGSQRYLRCMKLRSDAAAGPADGRSDGSRLAAAAPTARRTESESEPERKRRKLGFLASPRETEADGEGGGIAAVREKLLIDLKEAVAQIKGAILGDEGADVAPADEAVAPCGARGTPPPAARPRPARGLAPAAKSKEEAVKVAVSLSREEIEADFRAVLGHRPPRRPKKRAKVVQKNLDSLFPGLLLPEITAERYKVPELVES